MLTLEDFGWESVREWLDDAGIAPIYSDFGWGELVSAIALRVRMGGMTVDQGLSAIAQATTLTATWPTAPCTSDDLTNGARFVAMFDLKLRFPDAIHLAMARRLECRLVTADRRQAAAAVALGILTFNPHEEP